MCVVSHKDLSLKLLSHVGLAKVFKLICLLFINVVYFFSLFVVTFSPFLMFDLHLKQKLKEEKKQKFEHYIGSTV